MPWGRARRKRKRLPFAASENESVRRKIVELNLGSARGGPRIGLLGLRLWAPSTPGWPRHGDRLRIVGQKLASCGRE